MKKVAYYFAIYVTFSAVSRFTETNQSDNSSTLSLLFPTKETMQMAVGDEKNKTIGKKKKKKKL